MEMTKLTATERKALMGILASEFMDGAKGADAVGVPVWTWSANPFDSKRTFSGAVASLVKKDFAGSTDEGRDSTIWITAAGYAALHGQEHAA
jgi:hypothetical protein